MTTTAIEISSTPVSAEDLRSSQLFHELDHEELARLSRCFVEMRVPADIFIIEEGERSEAFYLVREGTVAVFRDAVGEPLQLLAHLRRGEFFGELGLFGTGRQEASVRTTEPCRLLKMARRDLLEFVEHYPEIRRKLQATAAYRYTTHVAAALELGRRREVRIRFEHPVTLRLEDGEERPATLLNLSLGGSSLGPAPQSWQPGERVRFGLGLESGELKLAGTVSWRQGERVGLAFEKSHPNHNMLIQLTIRMLLEKAS